MLMELEFLVWVSESGFVEEESGGLGVGGWGIDRAAAGALSIFLSFSFWDSESDPDVGEMSGFWGHVRVLCPARLQILHFLVIFGEMMRCRV